MLTYLELQKKARSLQSRFLNGGVSGGVRGGVRRGTEEFAGHDRNVFKNHEVGHLRKIVKTL